MASIQTNRNNVFKKRKTDHPKFGGTKKRAKIVTGITRKTKIDGNMKKLFRVRARNYHSDEEDQADEKHIQRSKNRNTVTRKSSDVQRCKDGVNEHKDKNNEDSSDGEDDPPPEVTRFTEGCRAFRSAFVKIMKKKVVGGSLGPVLSGNKVLVANKLSEELDEQKHRANSKKEKLLEHENGHVRPANFLDSLEKFLLSVATKGVVKFFNAVNKAQNSQSTSSKRGNDAKNTQKETFFTELERPSQQSAVNTRSRDPGNENEPAWAPLQKNYMQSSSKSKNWDTMEDSSGEDERMADANSSGSDDGGGGDGD